MKDAAWASSTSIEQLYARLAPARARLAANDEQNLATQIALSEIASPTGGEAVRGEELARRFHGLGLRDIRVDEVGNVVGVRAGTETEAPVVVCSHLDTVFPRDTPVHVTREADVVRGPGIVDNARGLSAMLAVAGAMKEARMCTRRPIVFAGTVGEEGMGDLRGAKHLFATLPMEVACCIALDGAGDERIVTRALGSKRFRVTFTGPGGHSWSDFGAPNPVHAAGATASRLALLPLPRTPRATLSVCRIGGGISINAIPAEAWLEIDLRSSSAETLASCTKEIEQIVQVCVRDENLRRHPRMPVLTSAIAVIGDRPCGSLADDHPLVRAAVGATSCIGRSADLALASTDANVPISLGIPSIAIGGGGSGGGVHTTDEWYDNANGVRGLARALTVLVAAAGHVSS